jgi:2-pyrone-4,6-dicarboxylate lactonase
MRQCPPPLREVSTPALAFPPLACDAHCHVFGPAEQFPFSTARAYTPEDAPKERLFALHAKLGIERCVVVQASCHGTDNTAMLDAIAARPESIRGVAGLALNTSAAEIERLHAAGVRGARFNFMSRIIAPPKTADIDPLLDIIADFGWHVVLHFDPDQLPALQDWIKGLRLPVLIDHMARLMADDYDGPWFHAFCELMRRDFMWTKISGAERSSATGAPWDDVLPIAHALIDIAPDRLLWGTDWPHPVLSAPMPDDGALVDFAGRMMPDAALRQRILVDNPARLYGF